MRSSVAMATVLLVTASLGRAQSPAFHSGRLSAAVGLLTPGVRMPDAFSASVTARMRRLDHSTLFPQIDATVSSGPGVVGNMVVTGDLVFRYRVGALSTYVLGGVGMMASYHRSILTGGVGSEFSWRARQLFAEFRAYGPSLYDMNGFRIGVRF